MLKVKLRCASKTMFFGIELVGEGVVTAHNSGKLVEYQTVDGKIHSHDFRYYAQGNFSLGSKVYVLRSSRLNPDLPYASTEWICDPQVGLTSSKLGYDEAERHSIKHRDYYSFLAQSHVKKLYAISIEAQDIMLRGFGDTYEVHDILSTGWYKSKGADIGNIDKVAHKMMLRRSNLERFIWTLDPQNLPQLGSDECLVINEYGEVAGKEKVSGPLSADFDPARAPKNIRTRQLARKLLIVVAVVFGIMAFDHAMTPSDKSSPTSAPAKTDKRSAR